MSKVAFDFSVSVDCYLAARRRQRRFDHTLDAPLRVERGRVIESPAAAHVRYRVV